MAQVAAHEAHAVGAAHQRDAAEAVGFQRLHFVGIGHIAANGHCDLVAAQLLRQAGFKVDLQAMDWQTLVGRRAKKDPIEALRYE